MLLEGAAADSRERAFFEASPLAGATVRTRDLAGGGWRLAASASAAILSTSGSSSEASYSTRVLKLDWMNGGGGMILRRPAKTQHS